MSSIGIASDLYTQISRHIDSIMKKIPVFLSTIIISNAGIPENFGNGEKYFHGFFFSQLMSSIGGGWFISGIAHSVGQKLVDIKSNLQKLATVGNYSQYKSNVHTHGQVFVETVKKLIYFVSVEEASYESLFVPVLREFCKACSFLGCDGVVKRELIIEGCAVAAFPDLEFQAVKLPFSSLRGYVTVSIAEVKTCDYSSDDVHKEKPKTRSNSEQGETVSSKFVPWEIKGAAQHAGQLLLEAKRSAFKPFSYGLLFTGSKIIMTCLEVSPYYFNHVGERLREHDKGKLYYSDMFDIL